VSGSVAQCLYGFRMIQCATGILSRLLVLRRALRENYSGYTVLAGASIVL